MDWLNTRGRRPPQRDVRRAGRSHPAGDPRPPGRRRGDGERAGRAVRRSASRRSRSTSRCSSGPVSSAGASDAQYRPCRLEAEPLDSAVDWIERTARSGATGSTSSTAPRRHPSATHQEGTNRMSNATTPNLGEVTLTRIYDAPRELVFRCMIDARAPHPLLGTGRREHADREHHRRPPPRWRVRDDHGQRRGRRGIPDAGRVRRDRRRPSGSCGASPMSRTA